MELCPYLRRCKEENDNPCEGWMHLNCAIKGGYEASMKETNQQVELEPCPCGGDMTHFISDYTANEWCESPDWKVGIPTWKHGVECTKEHCINRVVLGYAGGGLTVDQIERHDAKQRNRWAKSPRTPSRDAELLREAMEELIVQENINRGNGIVPVRLIRLKNKIQEHLGRG